MDIEKLREGGGNAASKFLEFMLLKAQFENSLFCCFEGHDAQYYFSRIEAFTKYSPSNIITFNCNGKSQVIRLSKLINAKKEYNEVKVLYFIDRDFDKSCKDLSEHIYETPCYSIENFYSTNDAFLRILRCELEYTEADPEFETLIKLKSDRHTEFLQQSVLLNSWIACLRELSDFEGKPRLDISKFNPSKIFPVFTLESVVANYDLQILEELYPNAEHIPADTLKEKQKVFEDCDKQKVFRGKFETFFLLKFLNLIQLDFNSEEPQLNCKGRLNFLMGKEKLILSYGQYADTPDCLKTYLKRYMKVA